MRVPSGAGDAQLFSRLGLQLGNALDNVMFFEQRTGVLAGTFGRIANSDSRRSGVAGQGELPAK